MPHNENINNLRANDNDKYLALFFAPKDKKQQLAALFNFHYEISQIPLEVSESMIGMIKFQWWRDCFEEIKQGLPPRPHPIMLGLQHSNVNYDHLITVINTYEKLLDNCSPKSFGELEEFIANTQSIIFEQAANILETTYSENTAKAYSYTFIARKIAANSKAYSQLAAEPNMIINKLVESSITTENHEDNVFAIITAHYNRRLKVTSRKDIESGRWKLLLKLAFSNARIL